jgi:hypothetical protein
MIFNLFSKNTFPKLETFYLNSTKKEELAHYSWMALAVNQRSFSGSLLTKELALNPIDSKTHPLKSFVLAEKDGSLNHRVFNGAKKVFNADIIDNKEIQSTRALFNQVIDSYIQREIEFFTTALNSSTLSPRQLEVEDKSLEWMRVSFEVLTKGILESLTNPEYLFQSTLFLGVNPKDKPENILREIRLITFNLDMTFLLLEDHNLRILIYNKKPGDPEAALKPALVGDFSYRKKEMFDQFITLLSVVSKGIHA